MKNLLSVILFALFSLSVQAKQGGFVGPSDSNPQSNQQTATSSFITVEQAKALRDDAKVTLRGKIEKHLEGKHFLFKDDSGSITLEIDRHVWNDQTIKPDDLIEIKGEVDKDFNSIEIEVKQLKKVN